MKAAAREPRSASSTTSGTPSGVTIARWRRPKATPGGVAAALSLTIVISFGRNRLQEIEHPEEQHEPADRVARPDRHHPLPREAFQQASDAEHQHAAQCHL